MAKCATTESKVIPTRLILEQTINSNQIKYRHNAENAN